MIYKDWIKLQKCVACGSFPVDPCHVKTRGAGGKDEKNLIPLCRHCHIEQHQIGIKTFADKYKLDFDYLTKVFWNIYQAKCKS